MLWWFLKKVNIIIWPSSSTPRYAVLQRLEDSFSYLFAIVHCSIIHNSHKVETTEVSMDRWIDKQNVVYLCSGILFSHRSGVLMHATAWMNLNNIVLSEISHAQKVHWVILLNTEYLEWANHRNRKQIRVCQGLRRRAMESSCREFIGAAFLFGVMKSLKIGSGNGCAKSWMYLVRVSCMYNKRLLKWQVVYYMYFTII